MTQIPPTYAPPPVAVKRTDRNGVATAAFTMGLITFALGLLWAAAQPTVISLGVSDDDVRLVVIVGAVATFAVLLGAVTAIILGLIALNRPGRRARAGIAIGIGMYAGIGAVFAFAGMFINGIA